MLDRNTIQSIQSKTYCIEDLLAQFDLHKKKLFSKVVRTNLDKVQGKFTYNRFLNRQYEDRGFSFDYDPARYADGELCFIVPSNSKYVAPMNINQTLIKINLIPDFGGVYEYTPWSSYLIHPEDVSMKSVLNYDRDLVIVKFYISMNINNWPKLKSDIIEIKLSTPAPDFR